MKLLPAQAALLKRIQRCPKGYALKLSEDRTADVLRDNRYIFIDFDEFRRIAWVRLK